MQKAAMLLVLITAVAQPASAQWNLGAYAGWAKPFRTDVRIDSPSARTHLVFQDLPFETRSFQTPLYYGFRGGTMFRPRLGAEFELIHLKVFARVDEPVRTTGEVSGERVDAVLPARPYMERLNVSHGLNLLLGNLVVRFPIDPGPAGSSRLHLTGRVGLGPTLSHTEAIVAGAPAEHYEIGGMAVHLAGGAEVLVWEGLSVLGEYKYTRTRQHLSAGSAGVEFPVGAHHIVTGIAYRFRN